MEYVMLKDGTAIAYKRSGTGPPLVLVHGAISDHRIWQQVSPALEDHFTVYAPDRRSHGNSGPYLPNYTLEREFEDLAEFIDTLGEAVYLVGHSSGACYALFAALRTSNVHSLVLYEPPPLQLPPPAILERINHYEAQHDPVGLFITFMDEIVRTPPETLERLQKNHLWQMWITNAPTLPSELRSFADYKIDPASFATFQQPTLLLFGSESPRYMWASTQKVAATLPNSQVVILEGQGHGAMNSAPELFVGKIRQFLTAQT
ncbi:MAG: alpha/beta hydrolase [Chloroflexota bacterium]